MTGTFVNTGAILVGSLVGLTVGGRMPERIKAIVMQGLGLSVVVLGLRMALSGENTLLAMGVTNFPSFKRPWARPLNRAEVWVLGGTAEPFPGRCNTA